ARAGLRIAAEFQTNRHHTRRSFPSTPTAAGRGNAPGARRSTFDFSYRIPKLRNWLTLYDDSFVEDETSPIGYPRRSAHNPGIYLSHLPGLPHLDFRAEAAFTNLPELVQPVSGGFLFLNLPLLHPPTHPRPPFPQP